MYNYTRNMEERASRSQRVDKNYYCFGKSRCEFLFIVKGRQTHEVQLCYRLNFHRDRQAFSR